MLEYSEGQRVIRNEKKSVRNFKDPFTLVLWLQISPCSKFYSVYGAQLKYSEMYTGSIPFGCHKQDICFTTTNLRLRITEYHLPVPQIMRHLFGYSIRNANFCGVASVSVVRVDLCFGEIFCLHLHRCIQYGENTVSVKGVWLLKVTSGGQEQSGLCCSLCHGTQEHSLKTLCHGNLKTLTIR